MLQAQCLANQSKLHSEECKYAVLKCAIYSSSAEFYISHWFTTPRQNPASREIHPVALTFTSTQLIFSTRVSSAWEQQEKDINCVKINFSLLACKEFNKMVPPIKLIYNKPFRKCYSRFPSVHCKSMQMFIPRSQYCMPPSNFLNT